MYLTFLFFCLSFYFLSLKTNQFFCLYIYNENLTIKIDILSFQLTKSFYGLNFSKYLDLINMY